MEAAYQIVLSVALVAALWLNVRALPHVLVLGMWWAVAAALDARDASEMRLFVDAFGFYAILMFTLTNARDHGDKSVAEIVCAWLSGSLVALNLIMWSGSYVLSSYALPQEVFSAYLSAYGWAHSLLFLGSVLALLLGAKVRERFSDFVRSLVGLGLRGAGLFSAPKAFFRLFGVREHKT